MLKVRNNNVQNIKDNGIVLVTGSHSNEITDNQIELDAPLLWDADNHFFGIFTRGYNDLIRGNTITGTGSIAIYIYSSSLSEGHDELVECNNVLGFNHASSAAHYVLFFGTFNNTVRDAEGATYLNLGDSTNQFLDNQDCNN